MDIQTAKDHIEDLMIERAELLKKIGDLEVALSRWQIIGKMFYDQRFEQNKDDLDLAVELYEVEVPPPPTLIDSAIMMVNILNEGKVNPKLVYPPGRYCGD